MKKYKQFILGLIVGAMLFSVAPISAAIEEFILYRADYKLVINGVEFNDPEVPLMNYKGYTVGSVRKVLEAAGIPITWNTKLRQAEVTSLSTTSISESEANYMSITTVLKPIITTYNGYDAIEKDGIIYVATSYLDLFNFKYEPNTQTITFTKNGKDISFNKYDKQYTYIFAGKTYIKLNIIE